MNRKYSVLIKYIVAAAMALSLTACGGSGGDSATGSSGVSLSITDAPVIDEDIAKVVVRVTGVIIHSDAIDDTPMAVTDGTNPWIDVNLTDLTEGKTQLLGDFELPGGHYSWIRLVIDPNNSFVYEYDPSHPDPSDPDHLNETRLDCSSCDESHLKVHRSFDILGEGGWVYFTIDFDLQKSLTLQLPQSEIPRPDDAYKLRPTLRIIDTELASTFIWGSVTDTRVVLPLDPADPSDCKVYVYEGDAATVIPDDLCVPADELDMTCDGVNNQRPLTTANVIDNGTFDYRTGPLYPGAYTVAMICPAIIADPLNADDNTMDEDLVYIGEQDANATLDPPDGLGVEANFVLADAP